MEYREVRRRPPPNITEQQRKLWKAIMKRAWYHDRNFCGCSAFSMGCGMISILSIIPLIGSIIAYKMHYKMIKMCHQAGCPAKIEAIMVGNIGVDFAMTLVPLLGVLLSWMKASSTRNAALFDTWLREESDKHNTSMESENNGNKRLGQQVSSQNNQVQSPQPAAQQAPSARTSGTQSQTTQLRSNASNTRMTAPTQAAPQSAQRAKSTSPPPAMGSAAAKRKPVPPSQPPPKAPVTSQPPQAPPKVPLNASSPQRPRPLYQTPRVPIQSPPPVSQYKIQNETRSYPAGQSYHRTESAPSSNTSGQPFKPHYPPPAGTYYNVEYA